MLPDRTSSAPVHNNPDLRRLLEYVRPRPTGPWETAEREMAPGSKSSLHLAPALDVFTGVDSVLQLKRFIYVWLKVKDKWLVRASKELQPPEFSTRRAWRTFMRGSFDPAPIKPDSEAGKSRLRFADYLGLSEPLKFDVDRTRLGPGPLRPLDKTVDKFTIRRALHELNELNFLHDVYEIELRRTWDLPSVIVDKLRQVAGGSGKDFFVNPSSPSRQSVPERLRWIVALRDIVKEWPTSLPKPSNFDMEPRMSERGPNIEDLFALELAVARFYCCVAEELLVRRPTIPLYR